MRFEWESLRKQWWLIPGLILILGGTRWASVFGRPVRVCDFPAIPVAVQRGQLVVSAGNGPQGSALILQPARGGRARRLPLTAGKRLRAAQFTATHLVYLSSDGEADSAGGTANHSASEIDYELHRVPWNGAQPENTRFRGRNDALLTAKGCYWWSEGEEEAVLNFLPLSGGEPQVIGGGSGTQLAAGPFGGAFAAIPTMITQGVREMVDVKGASPIFEQVTDVPSRAGRVELGGRLYWVARNVTQPGETKTAVERIVSTRLDGSDRRVALESRDPQVRFEQLSAHAGSLYLVLVEPPTDAAGGRRRGPVTTLCRVRPDDPDIATRVCSLPGQGGRVFFDGDDVYFALPEHRENWLDWSDEAPTPRLVTAWYHYRLPAK